MKFITIKDHSKLPVNGINDPSIGDCYVIRSDTDHYHDVDEGSIVTIWEVIRLTEKGYESKMVIYKVIK